jgi:hypothetical protein
MGMIVGVNVPVSVGAGDFVGIRVEVGLDIDVLVGMGMFVGVGDVTPIKLCIPPTIRFNKLGVERICSAGNSYAPAS